MINNDFRSIIYDSIKKYEYFFDQLFLKIFTILVIIYSFSIFLSIIIDVFFMNLFTLMNIWSMNKSFIFSSIIFIFIAKQSINKFKLKIIEINYLLRLLLIILFIFTSFYLIFSGIIVIMFTFGFINSTKTFIDTLAEICTTIKYGLFFPILGFTISFIIPLIYYYFKKGKTE